MNGNTIHFSYFLPVFQDVESYTLGWVDDHVGKVLMPKYSASSINYQFVSFEIRTEVGMYLMIWGSFSTEVSI
jgi:hypothetical protein